MILAIMMDVVYIKLLIENETAVSKLYDILALTLQEHAPFWRQLADEERAHAEVLAALRELIVKDKAKISKRDLVLEDIRSSINAIDTEAARIARKGTTMAEALDLAFEIETTLVDGKAFQVFTSDSEEVKREFAALRQHTSEHARRIHQKMG